MTQRTCRVCGTPVAGHHKLYCSERCRYRANAPARRAKARHYYQVHHERLVVQAQKRRQSHPGRIAASRVRYYEIHREQIVARERRRRLEDREAINARVRAQPERSLAKNQRRRARLLGQFVADISIRDLYNRDAGVCHLCGEHVDYALRWPERLSKSSDHVIPLARGGTHEPDNMALAHLACNWRKGASLGA